MCEYCSGSGNYSMNASYSPLEQTVNYSSRQYSTGASYSNDISYLAAEAVSVPSFKQYLSLDTKPIGYGNNQYQSKPLSVTYAPMTSIFLSPERPGPVFIGEISQIKDLIVEAFQETTGRDFPKDVAVRMLDEREFRKYTNGDNILGFAINRKGTGMQSEVFIKKGELAKIMLTIGHELGHVLSNKLRSAKDEEAKAFAFSLAWMKAIKENNIGNLATAIRLEQPAKNGLHDTALDFVLRMVQQGIDAIDVYNDLISKDLVVE